MATDSAESLARRSVTIKQVVLNKRSHGTLLPGVASRRRANAAKDGHVVTAAFQNTSGSVAAVACCNVVCCYLLFNGRTIWLPAGVIFSKERHKVGLPAARLATCSAAGSSDDDCPADVSGSLSSSAGISVTFCITASHTACNFASRSLASRMKLKLRQRGRAMWPLTTDV